MILQIMIALMLYDLLKYYLKMFVLSFFKPHEPKAKEKKKSFQERIQ